MQTATYAKPLVTVYDDGPSEHQFISKTRPAIAIDGGVIFGAFDAFVGVSLDDGTSWKTTNVSRSADLSSFTLENGTEYPGHVHNIVHQVVGDQHLRRLGLQILRRRHPALFAGSG